MASIDRIEALANQYKKKKKKDPIQSSLTNIEDLAKEIKSGNKTAAIDYMGGSSNNKWKGEDIAPVKEEKSIWSNILTNTKSIGSNLLKSAESGLLQFNKTIAMRNDETINSRNKTFSNMNQLIIEKAKNEGASEQELDKLREMYGYKEVDSTGKIQTRIDELNKQMVENVENTTNPVAKKVSELSQSMGNTLVGMGASVLNPMLGVTYFTGSATGSYYDEGLKRGMTKEEAKTYGGIMGGLEGLTDHFLAASNIKGVKSILEGKGVKNALKSFGLEISENFVQEAVMPSLSELTAVTTAGKEHLNYDFNTADGWKDLLADSWSDGVDGALSTILLGGTTRGVASATRVANKLQNKQQVSQEEIATAVKDSQEAGVNVEEILKTELTLSAEKKLTQEQAPVQQQLEVEQPNAQQITDKTYYHGTRGEFDTFDNSKIGQNYEGDWSSLGKGFYFTNDSESAKKFGESSINEGEVTVKEAKLDIKKPFYVDDFTKNDKQTIDNIKAKYELGDIANGYNLIDALKKKGLDSTEVLKESGYDGIIAEDEVMVFDASQINTNKQEFDAPVQEAPLQEEVQTEQKNDYEQYLQYQQEVLEEAKSISPSLYEQQKKSMESEKKSVKGYILRLTGSDKIRGVQSADSFFNKRQTDVDKYNGKRVKDGKVSVLYLKKGNNEAKLSVTEGKGKLWIDELYVKNQKQGYGREIVEAVKKYASEKGLVVDTNKEVGTAKGFWDKTLRNQEAKVEEVTPNTVQDAPMQVTQSITDEDSSPTRQEAKQETNINGYTKGNSFIFNEPQMYTVERKGKTYKFEARSVNNETGEYAGMIYFDSGLEHFTTIPKSDIKELKSSNIETPVQETESVQNEVQKNTEIPTQQEIDNLLDIQKNKSGSEYASAFYDLKRKYGDANLYKALNEEYSKQKNGTKEVVKQVEEVIKPLQETVEKLAKQLADINTTPASQEAVEKQRQEDFEHITEDSMPTEVDETTPDESTYEDIESSVQERDMQEVGDRKVKAYQYEHPEVRPYFQTEAENMIGELDRRIEGERLAIKDQEGYITDWAGISRSIPEDIAYLKDRYGYSYAEIEKGLKAIIKDEGAENNAVSKRLEILIDERLTKGYSDFLEGYPIPPNQEYKNLLIENDITDYYSNLSKSLDDADNLTEVEEEVAPEPQKQAVEQPKTEVEEIVPPTEKVAQNENTDVPETKLRSWAKTSTESEVVKGEIDIEDLDNVTYEVKSNKKTLETANASIERNGYNNSVDYFNSKLMDKKVSVEDIVLGERLIQEALKKGDKKTASELIENVSILGTELGQKIQALSIIQKLRPEGQLRILEKVVQRGKTKGDKAFENVQITQEMKDKILSVVKPDGTYDQLVLNEVVEQVKQEVADQMETTFWDKANAWRYLAMLGNPKTHIRNLISNVAMKGTTAVKNVMARTIEDVTSAIAPTKIKERTKTWKDSSKDVLEYADKTTLEVKKVLNDESSFSEDTSIKSKRQMFKTKILEKIYNFNSDMLTKEDWWFKKSAFKNSFAEYLTANGIKTKDDIKNNYKIVEKAKLYAMEQAQIATFSQMSYLANKINEIENKNIAGKIIVGSTMPFKRTPINIAKTGLAYSPLGFAKTLTVDRKAVKEGKMEASQLIDNIAKNTTGSALMLVGYMLAQAGFLNGGGEDDKEGKYDSQLGDMVYSIKIGDTSYSLSWLSPVAMPLFIGANAYEKLIEKEEWNTDVVINTLAQTLDPLSEMSFLSGLTQVLSSYETGSMEQIKGMVESIGQNYLTQFAPTLLSQVAGTLDDTKRTTTETSASGNKFINTTINKLKYKIPGLRQTLEPSIDIWGNEVKQADTIGQRAIDNFIAPYSKKKDITTQVDTELKEIYRETGENSVLPTSSISSNLDYKNEKYKMTNKEYTDFKKKYGQTAYEMLEELFETDTYAESDDTEKAKLISNVYEYARDVSKKEYFDKHEVNYTNTTEDNIPVYKEKPIKKAIEYDMTPEEYSYFEENPAKYKTITAITDYETYKTYSKDIYDLKGDKDRNGKTISNSRKVKVFDYINGLNLGFEQKVMLAKMEYPSYDEYNYEIIDYLNNNSSIDYDTMESILLELGFKVDANGNINW